MAILPKEHQELEIKSWKLNCFYIATLFLLTFMCYRSIAKYQGQKYWSLGMEQSLNRNWEASIIQLSEALKSLPNQGELIYQLGASYIFNGQYSRGLYFTNESKNYFNDKNIYLSESYALIQLGKYEDAEKRALKALSIFPTQIAPHLLLGEIYYYQDRIEESKRALLICINEDTPIKSTETKQISNDAKKMYSFLYD
jgi:tetratricopeptide (TPR) repeat protein